MKSAEEIAEWFYQVRMNAGYTAEDADGVRAMVKAAIEADRAQHDLSYARSIIDKYDGRAVIWDPEDIDSMIEEMFGDELTERERLDMRARVMESWRWRALDDATEDGWEIIRSAIEEADAVRTNTEEN